MKKTKLINILTVLVVCVLSFTVIASAVENSYIALSSPTKSFSPENGSLTVSYYDDYVKTFLTFKYSAESVAEIRDMQHYGDLCAGMDIKSYSNSSGGTGAYMDAYAITSTLPNYKPSMEANASDGFTYCNEAEAVAMGTIEANTYYNMYVYWHDYRTGTAASAGRWSINAESSALLITEFMTHDYDTLASLNYGKNKGSR